MSSRFIPDYSADAMKLVETVTGLVKVGRTPLAIAHLNTSLRMAWGDGCSVGMGETIETDNMSLGPVIREGRA